MGRPRGKYGSHADGEADTISICQTYYDHKDYYDELGEAENPTTSGLRYCFKKVKNKFPKATMGRVRDWWKNGTWHKSRADMRRGKSLLTPSQERVLAHYVIQSAVAGKAMRVSEIKLRARWIAEKNGVKVKKGSQMRKWFEGWLQRTNKYASENKMGVEVKKHTDARIKHNGKPVLALKVRHKGRALSNARARALNPTSISGFEKKCVTPFLEYMASTDNGPLGFDDIANFDEWMFDCQESLSQRKVCGPPDNMFNRVPKERADHVTVLSGHVGDWATPVLIIFASKTCTNAPEWMSVWQKELESRPELGGYVLVGASENGWVTSDLKRRWFKYVTAHPDFPNKGRTKLWVADGHYTNHDRRLWNYMLGKRFAFKIDNDDAAAEEADRLCAFDDNELDAEEPEAEDAAVEDGGDDEESMEGDALDDDGGDSEQANSDMRAARALGDEEQATYTAYNLPRPAGLAQQLLCLLPSHMTHGLQQMDNGIIRATKRAVGLVMDQFHDSTEREEALSKADMVYAIAIAIYGGEINNTLSGGEKVTIQGGHSPDMIRSSCKRVGWKWGDGEPLRYDPLGEGAIPGWKLYPAEVVPGVGSLGPTKDRLIKISDSKLGSGPGSPCEGEAESRATCSPEAMLAAEAFAKRVERPIGKPESSTSRARKRKSNPDLQGGMVVNDRKCKKLVVGERVAAKEKAAEEEKAGAEAEDKRVEAAKKAAVLVNARGEYEVNGKPLARLTAALRAHNVPGVSKVSREGRDALEEAVSKLTPTEEIKGLAQAHRAAERARAAGSGAARDVEITALSKDKCRCKELQYKDDTTMRKVRDDIISHELAEGRANSVELTVNGKGVTDYRATLAQMGAKGKFTMVHVC